MKLDFTYYDFIAILIPGFLTICLVLFFFSECSLAKLDDMMRLSIGSSALFIIAAYLVGSIVQTLSKYTTKFVIFKLIYKGLPTVKIYDEQCSYFAEHTRKTIMSCVQKQTGEQSKDAVMRCFELFNSTIRKDEKKAAYLDRFLSQANMYRALCLISLICIIAQILFMISDAVNLSSWLCGIIATSVILVFSGSRYYDYSVQYAKKFYALYEEMCPSSSNVPKRAIMN